MNNNYFSMRNLAAFMLLLFASMTSILAATPPGKVTSVNPGAHTFKAQWIVPTTHHHFTAGHQTGSVEKTFKTTDKTIYLVGSAKGSWSDVTKGAQVNILAAHNEGSDRVVDKVQIVPGS
jgi:hypothetical protein